MTVGTPPCPHQACILQCAGRIAYQLLELLLLVLVQALSLSVLEMLDLCALWCLRGEPHRGSSGRSACLLGLLRAGHFSNNTAATHRRKQASTSGEHVLACCSDKGQLISPEPAAQTAHAVRPGLPLCWPPAAPPVLWRAVLLLLPFALPCLPPASTAASPAAGSAVREKWKTLTDEERDAGQIYSLTADLFSCGTNRLSAWGATAL